VSQKTKAVKKNRCFFIISVLVEVSFFPPQAPRESIYGGRYFMHSLYTLWQVDSAAAEHHPFYEHVFINAASTTRERVLNLMRAHLAQLCMKYTTSARKTHGGGRTIGLRI
jgi:hypothetical protein